MTCGIYAIVCTKTWRSYVGQTCNTHNRFQDHLQLLRKKKHSNMSLQIDFDIYGENTFYYEIIENVIDDKLLGEREAYWISSGVNLYNKTNPSKKINLSEDETLRFWNWIDIKSTEECWNWIGTKDKDGYGRIGFIRDNKKQMYRSHRVAYFINNQNDDINLLVRHKCNNTSCCNPNHLHLGSGKENSLDKLHKENNHYVLNWELVSLIRQKFSENPNIKPKDLNNWFYKEYNISIPDCHIIQICINRSWVDKEYTHPERNLKYFLKDYDIELINRYFSDGLQPSKILKILNIEHNIPISKTQLYRTIKRIKSFKET